MNIEGITKEEEELLDHPRHENMKKSNNLHQQQ